MIPSTYALLLQGAPATGAPTSTTGTPGTTTGTQQPGAQSPLTTLLGGQGGFFMPMVLIFAVFYFMLIRPQRKQQQEQANWLKSLKKGDEVVTSGGLIGKIAGLTENTVTLDVDKVRLKLLRSHISGKAPAPGQKADPKTEPATPEPAANKTE